MWTEQEMNEYAEYLNKMAMIVDQAKEQGVQHLQTILKLVDMEMGGLYDEDYVKDLVKYEGRYDNAA